MLYTELRIFNISQKLSKRILDLIIKIPNNWTIKDVDQIKRSSSSIPANIAEGHARRFYPRDFIRYLSISLGSSDETQVHLNSLYNQSLISKSEYENLFKEYKNLSIKILNYINFLKEKHNITV